MRSRKRSAHSLKTMNISSLLWRVRRRRPSSVFAGRRRRKRARFSSSASTTQFPDCSTSATFDRCESCSPIEMESRDIPASSCAKWIPRSCSPFCIRTTKISCLAGSRASLRRAMEKYSKPSIASAPRAANGAGFTRGTRYSQDRRLERCRCWESLRTSPRKNNSKSNYAMHKSWNRSACSPVEYLTIFNNLLTVINGLAEVAMRRVPASDRVHEYLTSILKAGSQARDLTRQLLAFSRKQVFQPRSVDINVVIRDLEKMLRRLIGEDIKMETVLHPGIATVRADPGQIEQILVNLIVNARDAIQEKSGAAAEKRITIETKPWRLDSSYVADHSESRVGPHVMIAISDSGVGMTEAVRSKIFEPFFTTKELGRGTGLGLATVYGIIRQNGGTS